MSRATRDRAVRAISVCDQIEAHLQADDREMAIELRDNLQIWAANAPFDELLVWCRAMRDHAERIIAREDDELCEGP